VCGVVGARMRDVSSRALEMSMSGMSVRRVSREVRLVMVDECGVPVRLMTMRRMSTSVPGQWLRMASARGVYLARMSWAVWDRLWSVQYYTPLSESFD
jgi:hypothetical protein